MVFRQQIYSLHIADIHVVQIEEQLAAGIEPNQVRVLEVVAPEAALIGHDAAAVAPQRARAGTIGKFSGPTP